MSSPEKPKLKAMLCMYNLGRCRACERGEHFCAKLIDKDRRLCSGECD